ncbi:hypothetical protein K402DRAFT_407507 [Aulographum hederae CBS 113979]|uniref:Uncharacterized protein n=1 Tax=Aulographum hederae CBS 113979 TaxID=1176131 RepID=A0A6G1GP28_9PEZI|nr:hypothetical protein K402DRAFT_407507 [Aulographum hederae CBS 113979]
MNYEVKMLQYPAATAGLQPLSLDKICCEKAINQSQRTPSPLSCPKIVVAPTTPTMKRSSPLQEHVGRVTQRSPRFVPRVPESLPSPSGPHESSTTAAALGSGIPPVGRPLRSITSHLLSPMLGTDTKICLACQGPDGYLRGWLAGWLAGTHSRSVAWGMTLCIRILLRLLLRLLDKT